MLSLRTHAKYTTKKFKQCPGVLGNLNTPKNSGINSYVQKLFCVAGKKQTQVWSDASWT